MPLSLYTRRKLYARRSAKVSTRRSRLTKFAPKGWSYGRRRTSNIISKRTPAFGSNMGNALHIDNPSLAGGAFPPTLFTKMRYSQKLVLTADNLTGRTGSENAFRLNSLFDPDFTGTGHQPLGFDQLTPVYNKYCVYKVEVNVRVCGYFGSYNPYVAVNVRPNTSTYSLGGIKAADEVIEQASNTIMDAKLVQSWSKTFDIAQIQGVSKQDIFNESVYMGTATTNPSTTPYLSVVAGTYDEPASSSNGAYIIVSFVYHTRWSHQNPLAQS